MEKRISRVHKLFLQLALSPLYEIVERSIKISYNILLAWHEKREKVFSSNKFHWNTFSQFPVSVSLLFSLNKHLFSHSSMIDDPQVDAMSSMGAICCNLIFQFYFEVCFSSTLICKFDWLLINPQIFM